MVPARRCARNCCDSGEDHFLESKKPMCLRPRKWDCCSDLFCEKWRSFNKKHYFCKCNGMAGFRGTRLLIEGLWPRLHVANLCQSTMLFGIVWVLLSQAFATWRASPRSRLCLTQASPSLKAPRLQAFEARDLLHQHNRKGQVVMLKTRRSKRPVFGFVFCTLNWMNFGDGVGASLVRGPYSQLDVGLCDVDAFLMEQRSGRRCRGGLKTGPSRRHRIQPAEGPFLGPRAKETCLKKGQKVDPLEIKSGPLWRVQFWSLFWPLHWGKSAFISSWNWFDQQQLRLESWTGEAHFCAPAFSYVLRSKNGSLLCRFFSSNFHSLEASRLALRPSLCASCGLKF